MLSERFVDEVVVPAGRVAAACCAGVDAAPGVAGLAAGVAGLAGGVVVDAVVGGGKLDAVPGGVGPVPGRVLPLESSTFCDVAMTDLVGSNVSSLSSPLVMST